MRAIVSDTTALIVLEQLDRLDLLEQLLEEVLIPVAVWEEWRVGGKGYGPAVCLSNLRVMTVRPSSTLDLLRSLLDPGEAEAIELARSLCLPLLIDERKGREVARRMKIPMLGLLGLILLAVRRGSLDGLQARELIDRAVAEGFRLAPRLYQQFIEQIESV